MPRSNTNSIFSKCLKAGNMISFLETHHILLNPREYNHYATKSIIQIYFFAKINLFPEYHGGHHGDVTRSRDGDPPLWDFTSSKIGLTIALRKRRVNYYSRVLRNVG